MIAERKIVQYLAEAHALESALLQTLTAHIAVTPRSEYRQLLERHLEETREQSARILDRLGELGESRNPLQLVYGIAQTAVGQVIAASKLPFDLIRGTGGEERLLKNAKDEAASEALEIATYDGIEALAEAAGDEQTATLAREHRAQEEAFLADLRAVIPQLARDVYAAEVEGDARYDVTATGAADAARAVADFGRDAAERARGQAEGTVTQVQEAASAAASEVRQSAGRAREAASESVEETAGRATRRARRTAADVRQAGEAAQGEEDRGAGKQGARREDADLPIERYDDLTVDRILPKLRLLSADQLEAVAAYESSHRKRKRVLDRIARLRTTGGAPAPARR